jgi:hypothetical protein
MSLPVAECGFAVNATATGNIAGSSTSQGGKLIGFYVNSTTAGTLVLRRGGSGGTVMCGTITPAIGFHPFPADFDGILHATIANLDVTFFVAFAG